jgi:glutamate N-acetyltransferase/amino-acid N-acetyltransferase
MVTVDGDTSTNDMVLVMTSAMAPIAPISPQHPSWSAYAHAFRYVAAQLSHAIARDGEGATKRIAVHVIQAHDDQMARIIAKTIAGSSLVKSAMYGADANWGRILAAAGRAGVAFDAMAVTIALGETIVLQEGTPIPFDEDIVRAYLEQELIDVYVSLGSSGSGRATAWGCDLTYDYVRINASYRS